MRSSSNSNLKDGQVVRTFTLRVYPTQLTTSKTFTMFYHPWRGAETYWLVPHAYIVGCHFSKTGKIAITISQAFFERGFNGSARAIK